MTRSLVIAPQWIGDAVMAEPLLAAPGRGAASAHGRARCPGSRRSFRAMPQVGEVIELPFAHGRLDWAARRRVAATLRGRFDVAYVLPNSIKSALLPWLAGVPRARRLPRRRARGCCSTAACANPAEDGRRWWRSTARWPAATSTPARGRGCSSTPATLQAALAKAGLAPGGYWAFAPGAEYGPAKRWPAGALRRAGAGAARRRRRDRRPARLARRSRALRGRSPTPRRAPAGCSPARPRCSRRWR